MKPIKLTMSAFGSYRGVERISRQDVRLHQVLTVI